jgi:hypothetical protein
MSSGLWSRAFPAKRRLASTPKFSSALRQDPIGKVSDIAKKHLQRDIFPPESGLPEGTQQYKVRQICSFGAGWGYGVGASLSGADFDS